MLMGFGGCQNQRTRSLYLPRKATKKLYSIYQPKGGAGKSTDVQLAPDWFCSEGHSISWSMQTNKQKVHRWLKI